MKGRIKVVHSKPATNRRADYYEFLGVSPSASVEEIDRAVSRKKSRLRSANSRELPGLRRQIERAVKTLADPKRRRHYDMRLSKAQVPAINVRFPATASSPKTKASLPHKGATRDGETTIPESVERRKIEPIRVMGINDHTRIVEGWQFAASRRVVVKQLSGNHRKEPFESDFADEAKFLAGVNCPSIVEVYSVDTTRGFYVMEYVDQTLTDLIADGKAVSEKTVTMWLHQSLTALNTVHRSGQFIGRLGEKSFLVTASGDIKLKDAPASDRAGTLIRPRDGQKCAAPELLSPDTFGKSGPHSDIYALGFLALELLAGRKFRSWFKSVGKHPESKDWMSWHGSAAEVLPPIPKLLPKLSAELTKLLERMIAKRVAERYETAEEVLEKLAELDNRAPESPTMRDPVDGKSDSFLEDEPLADFGAAEIVGGNPPNIFAEHEEEERSSDAMGFLTHPKEFIKLARRIRSTFKVQLLIPLIVVVILVGCFGIFGANDLDTAKDGIPDFHPQTQVSEETDPADEKIVGNNASVNTPQNNATNPTGTEEIDRITVDGHASVNDSIPDLGTQGTIAENDPVPATAGSSTTTVNVSNRKEPPARQPISMTRSNAIPIIPVDKGPSRTAPQKFAVVGQKPGSNEKLKKLLRLAIEAHLDGNILGKRKVVRRIQEFAKNHPGEPRASLAVGCLSGSDIRLAQFRKASAQSRRANQSFLVTDKMVVELAIRDGRPTRQILGRLLQIKHDHSENAKFYEWAGQVVEYLEFTRSGEKQTISKEHKDLLLEGPTEREAFSRGNRHMVEQMRRTIEPATLFPVDYSLKLEAALRTLP